MDTKELLLQLVNAVKEMSPEVWRIFLLQVKVMIINHSIWAVILGLVTITGLVVTRKVFKIEETDNEGSRYGDWGGTISSAICTGVVALIFLGVLTCLIGHIINPEYTAIDLLMDSLD